MLITATQTPATPAAPHFERGATYEGSGLYNRFVAAPGTRSYGRPEGYAAVQDAIRSLQQITIGSSNPAAGIYEHEGRYFGRAMHLAFDFDDKLGGYSGPWRLEQHQDDLSVLRGEHDGDVYRDSALQAIVDGPVSFDATRMQIG